MENIGDNIRRIRLLRGIKQATLADMLNLSINTYGKIERNEIEISQKRLAQIADCLEIHINFLTDFKLFLNHLLHCPSPEN